MRVALISPYALDVVGGVQAHVLSLADALVRAGDQVLVLGPSAGAEPPSRTVGGCPVRTVGRTVAVPANGSRAPIALSPAAATRLRALLLRSAPDIVHVHEPLVPVLGPAGVMGARSAGAARVLTFHATSEGGSLPRLYRAVRVPARAVLARGGVLTAVSPVAAAFHARMLGIDQERFTIVPNGVDVARFVRAEATQRTQRAMRRLIFLGRLEHRKGADTVLRAFVLLAEHRHDIELRVIGDGPLRATLERLRADAPSHLRPRIELVGRAAPEALPVLLGDADLALFPARGGESFGIVLLEAMAAGLPIVATDIPGYRAVARDGREALLVAPDDPRALAAAAARILDEPGLADRLRQAGRVRADEHDWDAIAVRTRAVHERALGVGG